MAPALLLAVAAVLAVIEAFHDSALLDWYLRRNPARDGRRWHRLDALSWAVVFAALGYGLLGPWPGTVLGLGLGATVRFTLFAFAYNLVRGVPLGYVGEVDGVDVLLGRFSPAAVAWGKAALLAAAVAALFLLT